MTLHILPTPGPSQHLVKTVTQALPALAGPWNRLEGGRVNALWRVGDTVIKQYAQTGASPLFPNDPVDEVAALTLLAPFGISPILIAQGQGWVAYQYSPGNPWRRGPEAVAEALSRLHQIASPVTGFRAGANGSAQLLAQAQSIASLCVADLPPPPPDTGVPPGPTCLIHGDVVPGNIIEHNGRVTLIDWQCPAIGDPAEDIASFLSPAMQWLYRGAPLDADEVNRFRATCPTEALLRYDRLAMLYHWRMAAHCLWKSEQKEPDYGQALLLEISALEALPQEAAG